MFYKRNKDVIVSPKILLSTLLLGSLFLDSAAMAQDTDNLKGLVTQARFEPMGLVPVVCRLLREGGPRVP